MRDLRKRYFITHLRKSCIGKSGILNVDWVVRDEEENPRPDCRWHMVGDFLYGSVWVIQRLSG